MTNAMIILNESIRLMEEGKLQGNGHFGTYTDREGNKVEIEFPEAIHTFATWKSLGFSVKKGEHAIAAFTIWKYAERRREAEEENANEEAEGRMFLKKAHFFKWSQVERITA